MEFRPPEGVLKPVVDTSSACDWTEGPISGRISFYESDLPDGRRKRRRIEGRVRILVIGAGATGGYFGGRLAQAQRDVTFLVRGARADALQSGGLRIRTPSGETRLEPTLVTAETLRQSYDVILLAVKAYALDDAIRGFAPAVGPQSIVVPLLNGMRHIEQLQARFGADRIVGGLCAIMAFLDAEGVVHQGTSLASLTYGELDGHVTERAQQLHESLSGAGFDTTLSENVRAELWNKWAMLASLAATTCLMRAPVGQIVAAPGGREFLADTFAEACAIATAAGYAPAEGWRERTRNVLTAEGSPLTASMFRDMAAGQRVEVEAILGDLVDRAQRLGVSAPRLGAARTALEVYSAGRAAG